MPNSPDGSLPPYQPYPYPPDPYADNPAAYPADPYQGYPADPYQGYYPAPVYLYPPPRPTNGMAIASLVLGITGISVVAIILGFVARSQIRQTGDQGDGMAIAGIVLGFIWLVFVLLYILGLVAFVAALT